MHFFSVFAAALISVASPLATDAIRLSSTGECVSNVTPEPPARQTPSIKFKWAWRPAMRTTVSNSQIEAGDHLVGKFDMAAASGVLIGFWDEAELEEDRLMREAALRADRLK